MYSILLLRSMWNLTTRNHSSRKLCYEREEEKKIKFIRIIINPFIRFNVFSLELAFSIFYFFNSLFDSCIQHYTAYDWFYFYFFIKMVNKPPKYWKKRVNREFCIEFFFLPKYKMYSHLSLNWKKKKKILTTLYHTYIHGIFYELHLPFKEQKKKTQRPKSYNWILCWNCSNSQHMSILFKYWTDFIEQK